MAKEKKEKKLHKGDRVSWRTHGSEAHGEVEREISERTEAAGRTVAASPDEPQYEVRSDKSGGKAVHKPEALKKED
jgi:Hypervirulence associated proteins TUDOR domain